MQIKALNRINLELVISFIIPLIPALIVCRAFPLISNLYFFAAVLLLTAFLFYLIMMLKPNSILKNGIMGKTTDKNINARFVKLFIYTCSFGLWAVLTAIWSPFPAVSLTRGGYFIVIAVGAAFIGYLWNKDKRNEMFSVLLPANLLVILVSLFSLLTSSPSDSWSGGHGLGFKGYASHQNALASAIIFTFPAVLFPLIKEFTQKLVITNKERTGNSNSINYLFLVYLLIAAINIYLLIISVSRAALFTLVILIIVFILLNFKWKTNLFAVPIMTLTLLISFYTIPSVKNFIFKTEKNIGDRRIINITATIEAAKIGGLMGIGYGISAPPSDKNVIGHFENDGKLFVREKMIGMLALVEETGIIGLGLFTFPFFFVIWILFKKLKGSRGRERINASFLIAMIVAFCFHAQIEAWWVGVGSIELPLFYMLLGQGVKKD